MTQYVDKNGKEVQIGDFVDILGRWYVVVDMDGEVFLRAMKNGKRIIMTQWAVVNDFGVVLEDTQIPEVE